MISLSGKRIVSAANVDYRYWDLLGKPNGVDDVLEDSKLARNRILAEGMATQTHISEHVDFCGRNGVVSV